MKSVMIRIKRVYEPASPDDGARFLVERLWPRGMKKAALSMDGWLPDVAPTTALRQWFAHDPAKWPQFQRRYVRELAARHEICRPLLDAARRGPLTLLYSARDSKHNSAAVLKAYLERHYETKGSRPSRAPKRAPFGTKTWIGIFWIGLFVAQQGTGCPKIFSEELAEKRFDV